MGWRRILVFYVLAGLIGGGLYLEQRMRSPNVAVDNAAPPIVEFLASRIDEVQLEGGGVDLRFERSEGRWSLVKPRGVDIGSDLVEALLDTLTTIPPVELLEGQSGNLEEFGLDPAQFVLAMFSEDEAVASVAIGIRNPTRTAVYARVDGDGPVYLLGFNAQYYIELIVDEMDKAR
jgi:hypothetical protein